MHYFPSHQRLKESRNLYDCCEIYNLSPISHLMSLTPVIVTASANIIAAMAVVCRCDLW